MGLRVHKKKQKKYNWKRFFFWIVSIFFTIVICYILFFSQLTKITIIDIKGTQIVNVEDIKQQVDVYMHQKNFVKMSNNNWFLCDTSKIEQLILNQNSRIQSVSVYKKFAKTMVIEIVEYDIMPIVCIKSMEGVCYEVSKDSCIIDQVDVSHEDVVNNPHVFIVIEHNVKDSVQDACFFDVNNFQKMLFFGTELKYILNAQITQPYIVPFVGSHEVIFYTKEGWYMRIDLENDQEDFLRIARIFMNKVEFPSQRLNIEYIDFRFLDRVFYKMKNEGEDKGENEKQEKNKT